MTSLAKPADRFTPSIDSAIVLWRFWRSSDDSRATEGHVRKFNDAGDWVKISPSAHERDKGEWYRVCDLKLVSVLRRDVPIEKKKKPGRSKDDCVEGDEWKFDDDDEGGPERT